MKKMAKTLSITAALAVMIPLSAYAATTNGTSGDDAAKTAKPAWSADDGNFKGHGPKVFIGGRGEAVSQEVLDLLKLDKDALAEKIKSGSTLAEIAEAQGVSRDALKQALTDSFNKKIEEQKQRFADNVDKLIDSDLKDAGGKGGFGGFGGIERGIAFDRGDDLTAASAALGLTVDELKTALTGDKSLADVAKDKGVEAQKVIDAIVASQTKAINQAVTDGKLTQDQATKLLADVAARAEKLVNAPGFGDRSMGGHRGGGRGFGGERSWTGATEAPSASASESSSSAQQS